MASLRFYGHLTLRCGYWRGHVMSWMQRKNGIWMVCLHFGPNAIYLWTRPGSLQRSSPKKCHCQLLFAECGIVSTELLERFNVYFAFNIDKSREVMRPGELSIRIGRGGFRSSWWKRFRAEYFGLERSNSHEFTTFVSQKLLTFTARSNLFMGRRSFLHARPRWCCPLDAFDSAYWCLLTHWEGPLSCIHFAIVAAIVFLPV